MHKIWIGWLLIPILLIAFWIRIYHLNSNPIELFSDEITQVLSAKSIIETGRDINGKSNLFLYNKIKLGTPLYGYSSAISTYIFGNNTFAIRLPAAIAGTISIVFIFLITFLITNNKAVSLFTSLAGAIVPWGIYFSRIGWEPAFTVPFVLASIYFILIGIKEKSFRKISISFIFFALSFYASDTLTLYSPLFLLTILIINYKFVFSNYKKFILPTLLFLLLIVPFIYVSLTNPLKNDRAIKLSTFKTGINRQTLNIFTNNYFAHFDYHFLFVNGDPNLRHGTGNDGVLYFVLLPFVLIGSFEILKNIRNKNYQLLLLWLIYFPLGGSLTNDGVPHATRTLIGYPIFIILAGIGLYALIKVINNNKITKIIIVLTILLLMFNFKNFIRSYFDVYPINSQSWWEYGQSDVYKSIKNITKGNESLCLTNIDYWHEETLNHYYLGYKHDYKIIYDINNPECLKSDVIVLPAEYQQPKEYSFIHATFDLNKNPKWTIYKSLNSYKL